tara:strand:- start:284 stop:460 length:177 start_codon:yes stop_codon:yes gene_type:complete
MEFTSNQIESKSLEMATDDHYKQIAKGYRGSKEYGKMVNLYPILESSINECKNEKLIR